MDEKGRAAPGLTSADFRVTLNRAQMKQADVTLDDRPRRAVVVIDSSTGMRRRYWKHAVSVTEAVLAKLPPEQSTALLGFSEGVRLRVPASAGRAGLQAGMEELRRLSGDRRPTGDTNAYAAFAEALDLLGNTDPGDLLFFITDGAGGPLTVNVEEVRNTILQRQLRLVIIWIMPAQMPTYPPMFLSDLAEDTGGTFVRIGTGPFAWDMRMHNRFLSPSKDTVANVAATSGIVYRIAFPDLIREPATLDVRVVDAHGKERKGLIVNTPKKVLPCRGSDGN